MFSILQNSIRDSSLILAKRIKCPLYSLLLTALLILPSHLLLYYTNDLCRVLNMSNNYQVKTVGNVAFSRQLHTTENLVHSQSVPCGNYCGEMALCHVSLRILRFYSVVLIPAILHNSYFIYLLPMPHKLKNQQRR